MMVPLFEDHPKNRAAVVLKRAVVLVQWFIYMETRGWKYIHILLKIVKLKNLNTRDFCIFILSLSDRNIK